MVTKADVFNLAKALGGKFVLPAILRSTMYGLLGGVLFFLASIFVYNFGPGLLLADQHFVLRMIVALFIIVIYTVLGVLAGLILGSTSSLRRKLPDAQEGIHMVLTPVTSRIIERIPIGQEGIPLENFTGVVDKAFMSVASESKQRSSLLSVANVGARFVMQALFRICRKLLLIEFIRSVQENGDSRINVHAVERFARERLVLLAITDIRVKLFFVMKTTLACVGVLLLIPFLLLSVQIAALLFRLA